MKPLLQALGYFALMIVIYAMTSLMLIGLLSIAGVAVVPGVFVGAGVLTIVSSIIAATMSYHNLDIGRDIEREKLEKDHSYRMKLLEIAEREKYELAESGTEEDIPLGPPPHTPY